MHPFKAKTAESYSLIAPLFLEDFSTNQSHFDWVDQVLVKAKKQRLTKPIVDLGCGPGTVIRYLQQKKYPTLIGVDFTPEFTDPLKHNFPANLSVRIVQNDLVDFVEHQSVNSIAGYIALFSLIHIPDPELDKLLRDLHRTLMPGGLLLLAIHQGTVKGMEPEPYQAQADPRLKTTKKLERYMNYFTLEELTLRLSKVGFKLQKSAVYSIDPKPGEIDTPQIYLLAEK